jgi:hypothetical protein
VLDECVGASVLAPGGDARPLGVMALIEHSIEPMASLR